MKQLIIGLGTGRCGTKSLKRLLCAQPNSIFSHENKPRLPWKVTESSLEMMRSKLQRVKKRFKRNTFVGDIAFYWLPYVREILKEEPETKFICLKRNKESTVNSFERKIGRNKNHWYDHNGKDWKQSSFDINFPSYPLLDRNEAISRYWNEYYTEAEKLEKEIDNFKIYNIDELNNNKEEILKFVGCFVTDITYKKREEKGEA